MPPRPNTAPLASDSPPALFTSVEPLKLKLPLCMSTVPPVLLFQLVVLALTMALPLMVSAPLLSMLVVPAAYLLMRRRQARRASGGEA